jgi:hypothetical protein
MTFTARLTITVIAWKAVTAVRSVVTRGASTGTARSTCAATRAAAVATTTRGRARFEFWLQSGDGMRFDALTCVLLNLFKMQCVTVGRKRD